MLDLHRSHTLTGKSSPIGDRTSAASRNTSSKHRALCMVTESDMYKYVYVHMYINIYSFVRFYSFSYLFIYIIMAFKPSFPLMFPCRTFQCFQRFSRVYLDGNLHNLVIKVSLLIKTNVSFTFHRHRHELGRYCQKALLKLH